MKNVCLICLAGLAICTVSIASELSATGVTGTVPDPTVPSGRFAAAARGSITDPGKLKIRALVVGADDDGVALVGSEGFTGSPIRAGAVIMQDIAGVPIPLHIKKISSAGVEIDTEQNESSFSLPGSFKPLPTTQPVDVASLRYIECSDVPLETILRLIADQTGMNIASSAATAETDVSLFLRNVTADTAVEEICRATGLWYRRDSGNGIIRVTTMAEYEQSLVSFREESTENFTLRYPNVIEVASIIYGLYPDRVLMSLGEDELLDDESNDISRRFDRFNAIADSGGSSFLQMDVNSAVNTGGNSGSGTLTFNNGAVTVVNNGARQHQPFSATTAKAVATAEQSGNTNFVDSVTGNNKSASIFITISRRNNMIIVRTGDSRAMDDIRALVKRLDVPTPMVLLEVKVLELTLDDSFNASVEFSWQDSDGSAQEQAGFQGLNPLADEGRKDSFTFVRLSEHLNMRLQMLEKNGKAKTLATPTLLTANNEVSRLFIGEERPMVKNITSQTIVTESGATVTTPQTEVEFSAIGTLLLLTPNINADRTVTLRLLQENSEINKNGATIPVYSLTSGGLTENVPVDVVSSRSVTGTFVAKDNMTTAIGGLIKETESTQVSRVPFLGRLPLIGWLFRSTEKVKQRSELIVTVKPHVISTPAEGAGISQSFLKEISAHPASDGRSSIGTLKTDDTGNANILEELK